MNNILPMMALLAAATREGLRLDLRDTTDGQWCASLRSLDGLPLFDKRGIECLSFTAPTPAQALAGLDAKCI